MKSGKYCLQEGFCDMLLYHGSFTEIQSPSLDYGRYNLDFGKGFYVTGLVSQAEKWARRRATMAKGIQNIRDAKPIVSVYEIDFDSPDLKILAFDGYTEEWLDFIVGNRAQKKPMASEYDVIHGNVADDDVAAVVDDYMRLLSKGRMDADGKRFFLAQLRFSKPNDQYCIASQRAISKLEFTGSYEVEG